jgi:hypothetical protein
MAYSQELMEYFKKVPQPVAKQFAELLAQMFNSVFQAQVRLDKLKKQQSAGEMGVSGEPISNKRRVPFLPPKLAVGKNATIAPDYTTYKDPKLRPGRSSSSGG